jgi:hypothetical protein
VLLYVAAHDEEQKRLTDLLICESLLLKALVQFVQIALDAPGLSAKQHFLNNILPDVLGLYSFW